MATIDEQFQQDLNRRMDHLIQLVLTLKKRVDTFMDEIERRDKETIEYCREDLKKIRYQTLPEAKTVVVDQDGEEYT